MYNALNEQYMFQEMHERTAGMRAVRAARRRPQAGDRRWWRRGSPCAMMTDVRMERGRTESIVGREAELDRPAPRRRRRHPDGAALR